MSLLREPTTRINPDTWADKISSECINGSLYQRIIKNNNKKLFMSHLNENSAWDIFRLLLLSPIDPMQQLEWFEYIILNTKMPIDKIWVQMNTGKKVTIFDLDELLENGLNEIISNLINNIEKKYETMFLRKKVQSALDIIEDLQNSNQNIELRIIVSCYIEGPLNTVYPIYHYMVLLNRYDLFRIMLQTVNDLDGADTKLKIKKKWINLKGHEDKTILHHVCSQEKQTWIKYVVSAGGNPLCNDINKITPFHIDKKKLRYHVSRVKR